MRKSSSMFEINVVKAPDCDFEIASLIESIIPINPNLSFYIDRQSEI